MSSDTDRKVKVQFVTRNEELKVPEAPIYAPVGLKRYGLSEIVNQLLESEKSIPFDFLIDGEVLRTSVNDYLTSKGLSTETTLTLEYTRSILPPSFLASYSHEDWVSACDAQPNKDDTTIATGSYDGVVRLWDQSGQVEKSFAGHMGAVKDVKWVPKKSKLVSASMDRSIHLWNIDSKKNGSIEAILQGHTSSVDALAANKDTIVSASADTTLRVWSTQIKDLPQVEPAQQSKSTASKKRRKVAESQKEGRTRGSLVTLEGHSGPVTGVTFHPQDPQAVYSVSQDHTIKTWDLASGKLVDSKITSFPLLAVETLSSGLIACGSSARHITLHDPKSTTKTTHQQLVGHTNFVSSIKQSPTNDNLFVSASHDGTCRIWDVRSTKSAFAIKRASGENSAVYDVDWHSTVGIISAGQDKKLQINQASQF